MTLKVHRTLPGFGFESAGPGWCCRDRVSESDRLREPRNQKLLKPPERHGTPQHFVLSPPPAGFWSCAARQSSSEPESGNIFKISFVENSGFSLFLLKTIEASVLNGAPLLSHRSSQSLFIFLAHDSLHLKLN